MPTRTAGDIARNGHEDPDVVLHAQQLVAAHGDAFLLVGFVHNSTIWEKNNLAGFHEARVDSEGVHID